MRVSRIPPSRYFVLLSTLWPRCCYIPMPCITFVCVCWSCFRNELIFCQARVTEFTLKVINGSATWLVFVVSFPNSPRFLQIRAQVFRPFKHAEASHEKKTAKFSLCGHLAEIFHCSFLNLLSCLISPAETPTMDPPEDGFAVSSILQLSVVPVLIIAV